MRKFLAVLLFAFGALCFLYTFNPNWIIQAGGDPQNQSGLIWFGRLAFAGFFWAPGYLLWHWSNSSKEKRQAELIADAIKKAREEQ